MQRANINAPNRNASTICTEIIANKILCSFQVQPWPMITSSKPPLNHQIFHLSPSAIRHTLCARWIYSVSVTTSGWMNELESLYYSSTSTFSAQLYLRMLIIHQPPIGSNLCSQYGQKTTHGDRMAQLGPRREEMRVFDYGRNIIAVIVIIITWYT